MNFNEEWNCRLMASRGQDKDYYENLERVKAYDSSDTIRCDGETRVQSLELKPNWTAIDIGSGPGTLTIPLARRLRRVTAVEPSTAMIQCLLKHKQREGLNNIDIICSNWEDVDIHKLDTYDLVIASYSLNMMDIKKALLKMNQIAGKKVYLYWFAGIPSWEQINLDLYPLTKNKDYVPCPKCDLIYNVLYESGIYPDIIVLRETCFNREFEDIDSALADLKKRLDIDTDKYDDILTDYIKKHYVLKESKLIFKDDTKYVQISWPITVDTIISREVENY